MLLDSAGDRLGTTDDPRFGAVPRRGIGADASYADGVAWTHEFAAPVRVIHTLHVVEVPAQVSLSAGPGYHPVTGTVNAVGFHGALAPLPGGGHRLHVPAELRERTGAGAGDTATVVLQPDASGAVPGLPDDLGRVLEALSGARRRFDRLPSVDAREMLAWIDSAERPDDRVRRIARVLARVVDTP